jgi:hypothetical protein
VVLGAPHLELGPHQRPTHALNWASVQTSMPRLAASCSLLPAASPATTMSVLAETDEPTCQVREGRGKWWWEGRGAWWWEGGRDAGCGEMGHHHQQPIIDSQSSTANHQQPVINSQSSTAPSSTAACFPLPASWA